MLPKCYRVEEGLVVDVLREVLPILLVEHRLRWRNGAVAESGEGTTCCAAAATVPMSCPTLSLVSLGTICHTRCTVVLTTSLCTTTPIATLASTAPAAPRALLQTAPLSLRIVC